MTDTDKDTLQSPEYRYYTVDLLTNQVLAEIPFAGVSYERAVKAAGSFSGKIAVLQNDSTRSWDLYKSTMPAKTGLYILRNGICVWGGIIWSRSYSLTDRALTINANEFTSYFHHRRVWKTWTQTYGATVTSSGGEVKVVMDTGNTFIADKGSSVKLEFYDPKDFRYNGFYVVSDDSGQEPTDDIFWLETSNATAMINSVDVVNGTVTIYTNGAHGFTTDDDITVTFDDPKMSPYEGVHNIAADGGSDSSYFTYSLNVPDRPRVTATGMATRPLPSGTWTEVTVSVRSDSYDYIRALIKAVFTDFTGIEFANQELTPGNSYELGVQGYQVDNGLATITTKTNHGLIPGQSVNVQNLGKGFNGDQVIFDTPRTDQFRFKTGGSMAYKDVSRPPVRTIVARQAGNFIATMWTDGAHGFTEGDVVTIYSGSDADAAGDAFNGSWEITEVPAVDEFRYSIPSGFALDKTFLTRATVRKGTGAVHSITRRSIDDKTNIGEITTADDHGFKVGDSVQVSDLNLVVPIVSKSIDAVRGTATITTSVPHEFNVNDVVKISGLADTAALTHLEGDKNEVILTTKTPHNFKKGDVVTLSNMTDTYAPKSRAVSNNVATLTFGANHNMNVGSDITVENIREYNGVTSAFISNNVAHIYTNPNTALTLKVNDKVTISGMPEGATITMKESHRVKQGKKKVITVLTLTTQYPHNFKKGQKVWVSGLGAPFDTPTKPKKSSRAITSVTQYTITFNIKAQRVSIPKSRDNGTVLGLSHVLNGTFTAHSVSTDPANPQFSVVVSGTQDSKRQSFSSSLFNGWSQDPTADYLSPINGKFKISSITASKISYPCTTTGRNDTDIKYPEPGKAPKPKVWQRSILSGRHTLTKVSRTTFSYNPDNTIVTYPIPKQSFSGNASTDSVFNDGTHTITKTTSKTFSFGTSVRIGLHETAANKGAYARVGNIFNTSHTVTAVNTPNRSFSFATSHGNVASTAVSQYGTASIRPRVVTGTYGPFPNNADIDIQFDDEDYSNSNIKPTDVRGSELRNVGDMLDSYSDDVGGFEYRIDCDYDIDTKQFTRTFVFIPIKFPDAPTDDPLSSISRYGADEVVFEYPGNINNVTLDETAENSATRYFAVGQNPEGVSSDAALPFAAASAIDLINAAPGEKWPILEQDRSVQVTTVSGETAGVYDTATLYTYAVRYLTENRPPGVGLTVSVNGTLEPDVGSYVPGQWCSLIIDDEFIKERLKTDLEPRDSVLVRKIDSYKVTVPDGTMAPEQVELTLVTQWDVDNNGQ